jgi:hypothetical protein
MWQLSSQVSACKELTIKIYCLFLFLNSFNSANQYRGKTLYIVPYFFNIRKSPERIELKFCDLYHKKLLNTMLKQKFTYLTCHYHVEKKVRIFTMLTP